MEKPSQVAGQVFNDTRQRLQIRVGGEESQNLLSQSVIDYRQALEVCKRNELPQDWALAQVNLGGALGPNKNSDHAFITWSLKA